MTRTLILGFTAGLAGLCAAQAASADVVALHGSTRAGVTLCENGCNHFTFDQAQVSDWKSAPVLSQLVAKEEGSVADGSFIHKDTKATWMNANSGHLTAVAEAITSIPQPTFLGFVNSSEAVEPTENYDLRYNFQATADGQLTVTGTVQRLGAKVTEIGAWDVGLVEDPDNSSGFGIHDIKTLSTALEDDKEHQVAATFDLKKGKTYSFAIFNDEFSAPGPIGIVPETFNGLNFVESADFDWSITEDAAGGGGGGVGGGPAGGVPEPASWALMILGFGVAGAQLRRRAGLARA